MKKILIMAAAALMMTACGNNKTGRQQADEMDLLMREVQLKDSLLAEVFSSMGDITGNLNLIKEREGIVTAAVSSGEIGREPTAAVTEDINAIDRLLISNRETIQKLENSLARLRKENVANVAQLEKVIADMKTQSEAQAAQIAELKETLRGKDIVIEDLTETIERLDHTRTELEGVLSEQQKQLNTGYYIIGSKKELVASGIVDKSGFISKTLKVNEEGSLDKLTKVDTETFDEVLIGRKKVEVVTPHSADSYKLVMNDSGEYVSLVITDKQKFWERSKVLVISYK